MLSIDTLAAISLAVKLYILKYSIESTTGDPALRSLAAKLEVIEALMLSTINPEVMSLAVKLDVTCGFILSTDTAPATISRGVTVSSSNTDAVSNNGAPIIKSTPVKLDVILNDISSTVGCKPIA